MGHSYPKLTLEALENLLAKRFEEGFLTLKDLPHPSTFKDMERATARILQAIKAKEKITIIGDYDVDGVVSTTLMKLFFDEIGYPIEWIIPNRFKDGYGLSANIIPRIKDTDLAITVDNGISALHAAALCKEEGIDLIITDHHLLPPQLPQAYAIVDQKQEECAFPYKEVCGAQIAWYLIASLKNALNIKVDMIAYMELVAIAVIADMMPLLHINRAMVQAGIKAMEKSRWPAIRAFLEHHQKERLGSEDIGFFLAPLLNSAGRMKDAIYTVEFLTSTNIYDARVRLEKLITFNTQRKETEKSLTDEALVCAEAQKGLILVSGMEWHEGVVGIVAARVAQHCRRPAIVLSEKSDGILKGSGRSFGEYDLFGIVSSCREDLEKFGGHQAAIGLSLHKSRLDSFKINIQEAFDRHVIREDTYDEEIVGELPFSVIDFTLSTAIKKYEPYGFGNPSPKFITHNVEILQADTMGSNAEHLRVLLSHEGVVLSGVQFKTKESYSIGATVSIVYKINENHFRGKTTLQLLIEKIILLK